MSTETKSFRAWRQRNGLTLAEVSGLTGYSVPFISRLESGERMARPMTKVLIARRLGADIADLFPTGPVSAEVQE